MRSRGPERKRKIQEQAARSEIQNKIVYSRQSIVQLITTSTLVSTIIWYCSSCSPRRVVGTALSLLQQPAPVPKTLGLSLVAALEPWARYRPSTTVWGGTHQVVKAARARVVVGGVVVLAVTAVGVMLVLSKVQ